KQVLEVTIGIYYFQRIAESQIRVPFRESRACHTGRFFWYMRSRLWRQGHSSCSSHEGHENGPHSTWIPREGEFANSIVKCRATEYGVPVLNVLFLPATDAGKS